MRKEMMTVIQITIPIVDVQPGYALVPESPSFKERSRMRRKERRLHRRIIRFFLGK